KWSTPGTSPPRVPGGTPVNSHLPSGDRLPRPSKRRSRRSRRTGAGSRSSAGSPSRRETMHRIHHSNGGRSMLQITKPRALLLLATGALLGSGAGNPGRAQAGDQKEQIVFTVRVPDDAVLLIGNHKTQLTGGVRVFETPALPVGRHYGYTLTATS